MRTHKLLKDPGWLTLFLLVGAGMAFLPSANALAQESSQIIIIDDGGGGGGGGGGPATPCATTVSANVVALDQVFFWNRRGACQPHGQIYALARDVFPDSVPLNPAFETVANSCATVACTAGQVHLRSTKRPRPIVLRMNAGQCLDITFMNLISPIRDNVKQCPDCIRGFDPNGMPIVADADEQPNTRHAGIHVVGMQLAGDILHDGSNVGVNPSSLAAPGETKRYILFAQREGQHLLYSTGANSGGEGNGGQIPMGLFGAVHVEPAGAVWLRSQVTAADITRGLNTSSPNSCAGTPGYTCDGHPILNYNAVDAEGTPIFKLLDAYNRIVRTDLTAIIRGPFSSSYPVNPSYPTRNQSFREFTIIYHDEIGAVQAFPQFFDQDPVLKHTLHSVRDAFAFNYGTGGIGSEILANRLRVGPEADCVECKYEEFFLASWTLGDPAQVVDVPANSCVDASGNLIPNCPRATQAFYPDDPSNVYHSYLSDHMKFRILHAGPKEHHIHHLHAHQWLYAPDSSDSAYLDSQALGPGAGFTLEMVYNGSGNRNQTIGDSIFHCHFYPHFAMGMWALWRVHDVFENGTRMLPDGEIAQGTPNPAIVPIPGLPMAPMPGEVRIVPDPRFPNRGGQVQIKTASGVFKFVTDMTMADVDPDNNGVFDIPNPGYPFWVPALAGSRPPHPPLDTIDDGGLPRHIVLGGQATEVHTRLDFTKVADTANALELAENGEPIELVAMEFHGKPPGIPSTPADRFQPSVTAEGSPAQFKVNGATAVPGAPYAEPCIDDNGQPTGRGTKGFSGSAARLYKAANIQLDAIFNKAGWHFPQQRIISLWDDVEPTFAGDRPPEPFFIRANSGECIEYQHTNLVPNVYELDDYQVRTPTDILGQHIHLVKFDVTSSDGSANGYNYEDGTFSPDEVLEYIEAINNNTPPGIIGLDGTRRLLTSEPHPRFPAFVGAQTTVQRWLADPVLNNQGKDRTLRTVFTHDHYGPSTHQQAGLYAGLVIEPRDSLWFENKEPGVQLGVNRDDGGPTSWQAVIDTTATPGLGAAGSFREFMFEFQDFAQAYLAGGGFVPQTGPGTGPVFPLPWNGVARLPGQGFDDPDNVINPPARNEVGLPELLQRALICPGGEQLPCPEAIMAAEPGTMTVNYRNEPIALRVRDPNTNDQAAGNAGSLSMAFSSLVTRADPAFNVQPNFYPPLTGGLDGKDPFTPLLRAYDNDRIQIRTLVGATEEGHNFSMHGVNWLFEPSWADSGYRNSQMMGISEHFEMISPLTPIKGTRGNFIDYLYQNGSAVDDAWNGLWGILRSYRVAQTDLPRLPNNPKGGPTIANAGDFNGVCPKTAPERLIDLTAVLATDVFGPQGITYNDRPGFPGTPLIDPTGIALVRTEDLDANGNLQPGAPKEPLVFRANAGDCIEMVVRNNLPAQLPDLAGFNTLPMIVDGFNANDIRPSAFIGIHAQLVAKDVSRDDGAAVGFQNLNLLTPPQGNQRDRYFFYAGKLERDPATGNLVATPVEFGSANLIASDPIKHSNKGAIGALIIEPQGATWADDANTRLSAAVCPGGQNPCTMSASGAFREFVVLFQNDINLRCSGCGNDPNDANAVPNLAASEDAEDSGQKAINWKTEPMWFRFGFAPNTLLEVLRDSNDFWRATDNDLVGGDPKTPVFLAGPSNPVRFRILQPGGHARNEVFALHGHVWEQEPWVAGSTRIGSNPLSMWEGARMGHGATNHFDAVLKNGAGGAFGTIGDYLFRDQGSFGFNGGQWGLLRVGTAPGSGGAGSGGIMLPLYSWDTSATLLITYEEPISIYSTEKSTTNTNQIQ